MNDRQRCEVGFIARVVYLLILGGMQMKTDNQHAEIANMALGMCNEPFIGLTEEDRVKLKRRVMRMEEHTIRPLNGKSHGEKILLIVYHFINNLVDMNYLSLPEGSTLAILTDYLLSVVDSENEVVQLRMDSAKKQAAKWLIKLQSEGYYR